MAGGRPLSALESHSDSDRTAANRGGPFPQVNSPVDLFRFTKNLSENRIGMKNADPP
jgi:hypothetical protein